MLPSSRIAAAFRRPAALLLALGLHAGGAGTAAAQTVVGNFSGAVEQSQFIRADTYPHGWQAVGFTMKGTSYNLTRAVLPLLSGSNTTAYLQLYEDLFGTPWGPVHHFQPAQVTPTLSEVAFESTGFALAPNTTYYLVLKPAQSVDWYGRSGFSGPNVATGPGADGIPGHRSSWTQGQQWSSNLWDPTWKVEGVPEGGAPEPDNLVPEPASILLFLPGLAAVGLRRRRRRSGTAA